MKFSTINKLKTFSLLLIFTTIGGSVSAQLCEWQLANPTYSAVDPDGAGPALGSATFTLQVRSTSTDIPNVAIITTGFSYQSANAMVPTTVGCNTVTNTPSNITLSATLVAAGYNYSQVNQCNNFVQMIGGQTFDRTAAGTLEPSGSGFTLTSAWTDLFTVTLWTLSLTPPEGGYVTINSTAGGTPNPLGSYIINDVVANEFEANSLSAISPLPLSSAVVLPVLFTKFNAQCNGSGTLVSWSTAQESNSSKFEVERSVNGTTWTSVATIAAAGNSASEKNIPAA